MRSTALMTTLLLCAAAFSACGETRQDRALSGAGIGAGVGALGAGLTGGNAASGVLWGGAAGAALGGFTDEKDLNLGDPIWRK